MRKHAQKVAGTLPNKLEIFRIAVAKSFNMKTRCLKKKLEARKIPASNLVALIVFELI